MVQQYFLLLKSSGNFPNFSLDLLNVIEFINNRTSKNIEFIK